VVTDGRDPTTLADLVADAASRSPQRADALTAVAGDQADAAHRADLLAAADAFGGLDLLVLNAGDLGPSPLPSIGNLASDDLTAVLAANVVAPHALVRDSLERLRSNEATVVAVTSDAAAQAYEGWGAYGASKAALEHLARVLAEEEPKVRVHRIDPGDLRTDMHQAAFPGEDISDRADPASAVPGFLAVIEGHRPTGGRWRAQDLTEPSSPTGASAGTHEGAGA
jgi:NAD(P)-dependent dehydrogenase (short-subunit alcohol dehydrogenase family)